MPLLDIQDLRIDFGTTRVVDGVSLAIDEGQTLGLVGESGCGKSVTALSIGRLLATPPARHAGGRILLGGQEVLTLSSDGLRSIRGRVVSYIFQEPGASLNPVRRIGAQVLESLRLHAPSRATEAEVVRRLAGVGIPAPDQRARDYPHQLSGGMQQRVMIALALASEPRLLVADEPTTALDATVQAQIMDLLLDVQRRTGMAILLITHNLGLVADVARRVAVMYAGQIVEEAPARHLLSQPVHPYTRALIRSVPEIGVDRERLPALPGQVPVPGRWPDGCRFAPRCPSALASCATSPPGLEPVAPGHRVRCPVRPPAIP
jgi:oligopeptide/dipeptide ABC transporter ATP-binding protein